ncbi:MAG: S24 family peptidase [Campylobacterales bacterium]|nr:S24 family peptidase [Campylobacterales bacterium]
MIPSASNNPAVVYDENVLSVPMVSMKASAGAGNSLCGIEKFEVVETMVISRSLLKTPPNGTLRMIQVEGYSMVPMLYPDTFLLFDEERRWKGDGLYVLNWRDDLMVKLLQIDPRGVLHIKSVNQQYESWTVEPDDQSVFQIVGKVLRIII